MPSSAWPSHYVAPLLAPLDPLPIPLDDVPALPRPDPGLAVPRTFDPLVLYEPRVPPLPMTLPPTPLPLLLGVFVAAICAASLFLASSSAFLAAASFRNTSSRCRRCSAACRSIASASAACTSAVEPAQCGERIKRWLCSVCDRMRVQVCSKVADEETVRETVFMFVFAFSKLSMTPSMALFTLRTFSSSRLSWASRASSVV